MHINIILICRIKSKYILSVIVFHMVLQIYSNLFALCMLNKKKFKNKIVHP